MIPLAVEGRWRLTTRPAARIRRPFGTARKSAARDNPSGSRCLRSSAKGMAPEAEAEVAVIGDQVLAFARGTQQRDRLRKTRIGKQRRGLLHPHRLPVRPVAVTGERGERAGTGEAPQILARQPGPPRKVRDGLEARGTAVS